MSYHIICHIISYIIHHTSCLLTHLLPCLFSQYRGPMVAGIPPREASDRLGIFQARFDELWRKYETYSGKSTNHPHKSLFWLLVRRHKRDNFLCNPNLDLLYCLLKVARSCLVWRLPSIQIYRGSEKNWAYFRSCTTCTTLLLTMSMVTMTFCGRRSTSRRSIMNCWNIRTGTDIQIIVHVFLICIVVAARPISKQEWIKVINK